MERLKIFSLFAVIFFLNACTLTGQLDDHINEKKRIVVDGNQYQILNVYSNKQKAYLACIKGKKENWYGYVYFYLSPDKDKQFSGSRYKIKNTYEKFDELNNIRNICFYKYVEINKKWVNNYKYEGWKEENVAFISKKNQFASKLSYVKPPELPVPKGTVYYIDINSMKNSLVPHVNMDQGFYFLEYMNTPTLLYVNGDMHIQNTLLNHLHIKFPVKQEKEIMVDDSRKSLYVFAPFTIAVDIIAAPFYLLLLLFSGGGGH